MLDALEELDLVEALVEKVLIVLDHLEAHCVVSAAAAKVAAFQRGAECRFSDVPAHLATTDETSKRGFSRVPGMYFALPR